MKVWSRLEVLLSETQTPRRRLGFALSALLCCTLAAVVFTPKERVSARASSINALMQNQCAPEANEFYFSSQHDTLQREFRATDIWVSKAYPIAKAAAWDLSTGTPVYGGGAYDGSYAKVSGSTGGNTITVHQETYLRWNKSHTGWSFGWPLFHVRSQVSAYTKIPSLPVKLTYKTTIQYQNSSTYPVTLTGDYHARNHSLNAGTYEMTVLCKASANPVTVDGTNFYPIGGTRCPIDIVGKAEKNGFTVNEKALAEGKVTFDIEIKIEPLASPPIPKFRGPIVNGVVVNGVSPGTAVSFINESYDADNNAGTTPGTGITAYDWTITDPKGGTTTYRTSTVTYTPPAPGIYQINLRVTDDEGQYDCVTKELIVCGASLQASRNGRLEADGACEPPTVSITKAEITEDKIELQLAPADVEGDLQVQLEGTFYVASSSGGDPVDEPIKGGPSQYVIYSGKHIGESKTLSFNPPAIPGIADYFYVKATWTVQGQKVESLYPVAFLVLGITRHSVYNTPHEIECNETPLSNAYLVTRTKTDTSCGNDKLVNCNAVPFTYPVRAQWKAQANINGSGVSIEKDLVAKEWGCYKYDDVTSSYQTKACHVFQPFAPGFWNTFSKESPGRCGEISDSTVAVAAKNNKVINPFVGLSDTILIAGLGSSVGKAGTIKKVTDLCPGCHPVNQFDNYTTRPACRPRAFGDLGNFNTILLRHYQKPKQTCK